MANITSLRKDTYRGGNTKAEVITVDITASASDTVEILTLKRNMVIDDVRVYFKGTGSSTLSLGDSGSATRYITTASTAADGVVSANTVTAASAGSVTAGLGYRYTADNKLIATIAGAAVSNKTYTFVIEYHFDNNA